MREQSKKSHNLQLFSREFFLYHVLYIFPHSYFILLEEYRYPLSSFTLFLRSIVSKEQFLRSSCSSLSNVIKIEKEVQRNFKWQLKYAFIGRFCLAIPPVNYANLSQSLAVSIVNTLSNIASLFAVRDIQYYEINAIHLTVCI